MNIKMKSFVGVLLTLMVLAFSAGCGKKEGSPPPGATGGTAGGEQAAQKPQVPADLYKRTIDRTTFLVSQNKFREAGLTIKQLDAYQLDAAQQQAVDALRARIPAGN
jgi:hypothetical protein